MNEIPRFLKDVVTGLIKREPQFYPDEQIDWEVIKSRIKPDDAPPCVASAFVIKDYFIVDRKINPEEIVFKSVRYGETIVHLWTDVRGLIVDEPRFRNQARKGVFNIYRYGRRDFEHEALWNRLNEMGLSKELRHVG